MKLKELITQYAAFRKSMGADFESAASLLNTFCRCMGVDIDVREIRAEQVTMFLAGTGPVNRYWRRKYDVMSHDLPRFHSCDILQRVFQIPAGWRRQP